ncbi:MAG: alpha/beta hydrolase fold domain-containing protein, partial [Saprospiraceae bacterium]
MKKIYFLFISLFAISSIQAQDCDGFRYLNDIATSTTMTTVKFGDNTNTAGNAQELFMDIYTPDGDTETNRPAIVFTFGGSFIGGSRGAVADWCQRFAKRGYVTAAIDYRLYSLTQGIPDSLAMLEVVVQAVADMKGAVRHLRKTVAEDSNPYGIDPDRIYAGGESAGALVALHAAYIRPTSTTVHSYVQDFIDTNGGIHGDTEINGDPNSAYSSDIGAVVSYAGALHRAEYIEGADAPPVVSLHGDADGTVPYGWDFARVSIFDIITVQGSSYVHTQAQAQGVASELYTIPGGDHGDAFANNTHTAAFDVLSMNFLHDEATCKIDTPVDDLEDISHSVSIYPNPSSENTMLVIDQIIDNYSLNIVDAMGREVRSMTGLSDNILQ